MIQGLGKKEEFVDETFPKNSEVLGFLEKYVAGWRRPTPSEVLFKGGISPEDVKQGSIGDCYLISSFGVLGQKRIQEIFGIDA